MAGLLAVAAGLPSSADASVGPDDTSIQRVVEDRIQRDPFVPLNRIDVIVHERVVTLDGIVRNLQIRNRAARIAESIRGVYSVINTITVRPYVGRSAADTRSAVDEALSTTAATKGYEIEVSAQSDSIVELTGTVQSDAERKLAGDVAARVSGIAEVLNNIRIAYSPYRPDSEMAAEIEGLLRYNVLVDDSRLDVNVKDGVVTLSGTVGSMVEKRAAVTATSVFGVKSVDDCSLEVLPGGERDIRREPDQIDVDDPLIEQALERAIRQDARIKSDQIDIQSLDGHVTLRGTVLSVQASRASENNALRTAGVVSVSNRLRVRPGVPVEDGTLAEAVRKALQRDAFTESWDIVVSAEDGIVSLHGIVDHRLERTRASVVAESVSGVEFVDNRIRVLDIDIPIAFDPYDDTGPTNSASGDLFAEGADEAIERNIEAAFWWSPFLANETVSVVVDGGVATLTGLVEDWSAYNAARELALESGARRVVNNLKLND